MTDTTKLLQMLNGVLNTLARVRKAEADLSASIRVTEIKIRETSLGERLAKLRGLKKVVKDKSAQLREDAIEVADEIFALTGNKRAVPDLVIKETTTYVVTDEEAAIKWAMEKGFVGVIRINRAEFKKTVAGLSEIDFPTHCVDKVAGRQGAVKTNLDSRLIVSDGHRHNWVVESVMGSNLLLSCPICYAIGLAQPVTDDDWLKAIVSPEPYEYTDANPVDVI